MVNFIFDACQAGLWSTLRQFLLQRQPQAQNGVPCAKGQDARPRSNSRFHCRFDPSRNRHLNLPPRDFLVRRPPRASSRPERAAASARRCVACSEGRGTRPGRTRRGLAFADTFFPALRLPREPSVGRPCAEPSTRQMRCCPIPELLVRSFRSSHFLCILFFNIAYNLPFGT